MILDDELKALLKYIENSSFVEFEIEREGVKLKLVRRPPYAVEPAPAPVAAVAAARRRCAPPRRRPAHGGRWRRRRSTPPPCARPCRARPR